METLFFMIVVQQNSRETKQITADYTNGADQLNGEIRMSNDQGMPKHEYAHGRGYNITVHSWLITGRKRQLCDVGSLNFSSFRLEDSDSSDRIPIVA